MARDLQLSSEGVSVVRRLVRTRMLAVVLLLLSLGPIVAEARSQTLRTIAIVELPRVHQVYFRQSQLVRRYERLRRETAAEIEDARRQLRELNNNLSVALSSSDPMAVQELRRAISAQRAFISDMRQRRERQLNNLAGELRDDPYHQALTRALEDVPMQMGYSLVIDSATAEEGSLIWVAPSADITDSVIRYLRRFDF